MPSRRETLILSGLLDGEADEVAAAFAPLRERRRLDSGLERPAADPALDDCPRC